MQYNQTSHYHNDTRKEVIVIRTLQKQQYIAIKVHKELDEVNEMKNHMDFLCKKAKL